MQEGDREWRLIAGEQRGMGGELRREASEKGNSAIEWRIDDLEKGESRGAICRQGFARGEGE